MSEHFLKVNGFLTSQEELRANAEFDRAHDQRQVRFGDTIIALLDLLEANQDLVEYLSRARLGRSRERA